MPSRSPEPLRALILEDEPRFRAFLADVIRDMGCAPVAAGSAAEAMRLIKDAKPDLLLLDLNLPVVDGMTFLERFRELCPLASVIILTGFGDLDAARRAIRLDVSDFLTKPCDLGQIEQAIDRARRRLPARPAPTATHSATATATTDAPPPGLAAAPAPMGIRPLDLVERDAILNALRLSRGNRSAAARQLGISRRALYTKLAAYRLQGAEVP